MRAPINAAEAGPIQGWALAVGYVASSLLAGVLNLLPGLLQIAFGLFGFAPAFQHWVAESLAGALLDLALGRLGLILCLVCSTHSRPFLSENVGRLCHCPCETVQNIQLASWRPGRSGAPMRQRLSGGRPRRPVAGAIRTRIVRNCAYRACHGYRTLPEYRHRLSRSGRSRDVLRRDAGLEGRRLRRLGRGPRGVRSVHLLPAGGGLYPAWVAGAGGAP